MNCLLSCWTNIRWAFGYADDIALVAPSLSSDDEKFVNNLQKRTA